MSLTGAASGPPTKSGLSLVDLSTGYAAAVSILAGLHRAQRDGRGCDCEVSLFETALHQLCYIGTWAATAGYVPERLDDSAHPSIVPFQNFPTADGWIVVACPKEHFWHSLCAALERPDLLADERFADFAARFRHREELLSLITAELAPAPGARVARDPGGGRRPLRPGQRRGGRARRPPGRRPGHARRDTSTHGSGRCGRSPRRCAWTGRGASTSGRRSGTSTASTSCGASAGTTTPTIEERAAEGAFGSPLGLSLAAGDLGLSVAERARGGSRALRPPRRSRPSPPR